MKERKGGAGRREWKEVELNANVMGIWENIFSANKKKRKHVADVPKLLVSAVDSRIFVDLSFLS